MKKVLYLFSALIFTLACKNDPNAEIEAFQEKAEEYILSYTEEYVKLYYDASLAEWDLNTYILPGDTTNAYKARTANAAFAAFTGSEANIAKIKEFLDQPEKLKPIQRKQLETMLYLAGSNPQSAKAIVEEKIRLEAAQTEILFGFDFKIDGKSVSANQIDSILENSNNLDMRLKAWEASKEVGAPLLDGLMRIRDLRNQSVQSLGYSDYFAYQVSEYGMDSEEMLELNRRLVDGIWELYRELHTWARYTLAKRYNKPVPDFIPAHWLPNRWGQEWSALVDVEGLDFDEALRKNGSEWIIRKGEEFYVSLGYENLPSSFYEKSSLYPLPATAEYKKNNHASAWHMDLKNDLRSLMSVEPNMRWWSTVLHELGHIYYFQAYSTEQVPPLLRSGANRAFHEAIGTLIGLASMQKPFLVQQGLVDESAEVDEMKVLLKEALDYIVVMPWASGVMTEFEYELYANGIGGDEMNPRWWDLVKRYQGIVPPNDRNNGQYCDAATKTHINNDAAQYYDYALANALLFQFHMHICRDILGQDPHASNYFASEETGQYLRKLMAPGATQDWRSLLSDEINSEALREYFAPLLDWLQQQNKGREHSLPSSVF